MTQHRINLEHVIKQMKCMATRKPRGGILLLNHIGRQHGQGSHSPFCSPHLIIMTWITLFFLPTLSFAYIPDYHMIMSRLAETHGRGTYSIEQDVIFNGDPDPLVIHETWIVSSENSLRLTYEGRGSLKGQVQGTVIYDETKKFWKEDAASTRSARLTDDWVEPFFHFRFSKNIKPKLVSLKMAPADSLKDRQVHVTRSKDALPEFKYPPQPFINLSRTGGTLTYVIGALTPVESSEGAPGIWIEQDQFVIRKIRLPSQTVIKADDYNKHSDNFWLPRTRQFNWGNQSVQIHVSQVKSMGKKFDSEILKPSYLSNGKTTPLFVKLPETEVIREFYQRFR